ncbi:MAG: carboxymuconolactone decarboxylase family protein [Pseudomonadota bacterium]
MPRLAALERDDLKDFAPLFQDLEAFFGFLPNDYLTMGRRPEILGAIAQLTQAVLFSEANTLPMNTRLLITYMTSRAAGCQYCIAHNVTLIERHGVNQEQIDNINDFATHPAFNAAERAALTVAKHANTNPNSVTDAQFDALRPHYGDGEIAEIVALIAMMSFYNRWNDTMATTLERPAAGAAAKWIGAEGWSGAKHA